MSCIGVWGSDIWIPRVPSILLLCECFRNGYHGYQVCPALGCGGAFYGYHGHQVYFLCLGVFVMGTTGPKYFGFLYWVPRVPSMFCIGVCGGANYGYHSFFVMGTTGTKYVLFWGVGVRNRGTTGTKFTSSVWVFL